jgi:hypothetical protein
MSTNIPREYLELDDKSMNYMCNNESKTCVNMDTDNIYIYKNERMITIGTLNELKNKNLGLDVYKNMKDKDGNFIGGLDKVKLYIKRPFVHSKGITTRKKRNGDIPSLKELSLASVPRQQLKTAVSVLNNEVYSGGKSKKSRKTKSKKRRTLRK